MKTDLDIIEDALENSKATIKWLGHQPLIKTDRALKAIKRIRKIKKKSYNMRNDKQEYNEGYNQCIDDMEASNDITQ